MMTSPTCRTLTLILVDTIHTHGVVRTCVTFTVISVDPTVMTCEPDQAVTCVAVRGRGGCQVTCAVVATRGERTRIVALQQ